MGDSNKKIAAFIRNVFDEWIARLQRVIEDAQLEAQIKKNIAPDILARQIVMSIEGGIMLSRLEKDERPLADCLSFLRSITGLNGEG